MTIMLIIEVINIILTILYLARRKPIKAQKELCIKKSNIFIYANLRILGTSDHTIATEIVGYRPSMKANFML